MSITSNSDKEFEEACKQFYGGLILTGTHRHLCPDWDFLPIDETCEEFKSCGCPIKGKK